MKHLLSIFLISLFFSCLTKKNTVCSGQVNVNLSLGNNCDEIADYLKKNNWRKHSFENAYVVDVSFWEFDKFMTKHKVCKPIFSIEDIISLFGEPNYSPKINYKGNTINTYNYIILRKDSLSKTKQIRYHYVFSDTLGNNTICFPKEITEIGVPESSH